MPEYQVKFKVRTGNLLPPYFIEGVEVYDAATGHLAIEAAKAEWQAKASIDTDEYSLQVTEVTKL